MDNLSQAVKQVLEEKGVLSELKAKIRAEIFESLQIGKELGVDDKENQENDIKMNRLKWNKQELVINELIKEYMVFHGLQHSLSVFSSETNHTNKTKKVDIHNELGYTKDDKNSSPLIYDIAQTKP
mmetsp:Transcript_38935/g.34486  ORF Transcript_38935/g.34486 Transcript_38935/m.34486 type:complete len:126 (-) Transcript_38935:66-443(-)